MELVERSIGRYRLRKELGRRGGEEVFEAAAEGLSFDLHLIPVASGGVAETLIADANRAASLRHINISPVHEIAASSDGCFAAFEQAGGGRTSFVSVEKLLADVREQRVPIPPAAALYIAREVASAIEYAHGRRDAANRLDPIPHGPLRPSAVSLSTADGGVLVGDFGWARLLDRHPVGEEALSGAYFAPESLAPGEWDTPADLFAVGALLYELLALRHIAPGRPSEARAALAGFEPKPASAVRGKLPPMVDDLIMAALAPQIADRPVNALAFQRSLSKALYTVAPFYTGGDLARFLGGLADGSLRAEAAKHAGTKREKKAARATVSLGGRSTSMRPDSEQKPEPHAPITDRLAKLGPVEVPRPEPEQESSAPAPMPPPAEPTPPPPPPPVRPHFLPPAPVRDTVVTTRPDDAVPVNTSPAFRFPMSDATEIASPPASDSASVPPDVRDEPPTPAEGAFSEVPRTMSWGAAPPRDAASADLAPRWGSPGAQRTTVDEEAVTPTPSERSFSRSFDAASSPSVEASPGAFEPTSVSGFSAAALGTDADELKIPGSGRRAAFIALGVAIAAGGGFAVWQIVGSDKKPPPPPVARADEAGGGNGQRGDAVRDARQGGTVDAGNGPTIVARPEARGTATPPDVAQPDGGADARAARVLRPTDGEVRREGPARATAAEARRAVVGRERRETRGDAARRRAVVAREAREARESAGGGGTGYLTVKSDRWAYVYVDGGKKRQTPLTKLPLKAGAHTVKLHDPNEDLYKEFSVTISAGQTTVKSIYW